MKSPIVSSAQLSMLQRVVSDAAHAKERGIAQDVAQTMLDAHQAAGSPDLPDRVDSKVNTPKPAKPRTYKLLGS